MRFFIALCLSFVIHVVLVVGLYIFNNQFKLKVQPRIITFHIDDFKIEQPTPVVKKEVLKKEQKPALKPIVKKKIIKKPQVKKPIIAKQKSVKKIIKPLPKKVLTQKPIKQEEIAQIPKKILAKVEDNTTSQTTQTKPTKKVAQPAKSAQPKLTDTQIHKLLSRVYMIINQYKTYPLRARKLNIQGEVVANFTLYQNGKISKIKIVKSSGVKFLDRHTIKTIIEASSVFPKPVSTLEMNIPIRYTLH